MNYTKMLLLSAVAMLLSCAPSKTSPQTDKKSMPQETTLDTITLGGGCFWCVEAVFQRLEGVKQVASGYMGGSTPNPTYKEICTGTTGHAEVVQIVFSPEIIPLTDILDVFFSTHDPTTLNRQGADVGTQYRSAIFTNSTTQHALCTQYVASLDSSNIFDSPVVTEVTPASTFYKAEDYHQDYYNQNGSQGYCSFVIRPKVNKLLKEFSSKIKAEYK